MITQRLKLGTGALVMLLSILASAEDLANPSDVPYDSAFESVFQLDDSFPDSQEQLVDDYQSYDVSAEFSEDPTDFAPATETEIAYGDKEKKVRQDQFPKRGKGTYRYIKRDRGQYHDSQPYHSNRSKFPWKRIIHNVLRPPVYFRNNNVSSVTCSARDRRGYNYSVVEYGYNRRMNQSQIRNLQDAALDKCYYESRGGSCTLTGCTVEYGRSRYNY